MNIVPCKCGAPINKIVFDCKNDQSDFGKYRRLTCMSCGQTVVQRGVVPGSDYCSLQDDWNAANAVVYVPKQVSEHETCKTCRFWLKNDNMQESGWCRRFPPTVINGISGFDHDYSIKDDTHAVYSERICEFPSIGSSRWCGEWKQVKA